MKAKVIVSIYQHTVVHCSWQNRRGTQVWHFILLALLWNTHNPEVLISWISKVMLFDQLTFTKNLPRQDLSNLYDTEMMTQTWTFISLILFPSSKLCQIAVPIFIFKNYSFFPTTWRYWKNFLTFISELHTGLFWKIPTYAKL